MPSDGVDVVATNLSTNWWLMWAVMWAVDSGLDEARLLCAAFGTSLDYEYCMV